MINPEIWSLTEAFKQWGEPMSLHHYDGELGLIVVHTLRKVVAEVMHAACTLMISITIEDRSNCYAVRRANASRYHSCCR